MHLPLNPRRLATSLLLLGALLAAGCATTTDVRRIIDASNYEMLVAADPNLATTVPANRADPAAAAGTLTGVDPGAAARLTAFLEANADDTVMHATLRLREALLHLNRRDLQLARASFERVVPDELVSPRDRALAAAFPELVWWTEHSRESEVSFRQRRGEAEATMKRLLEHAGQKELERAPDVRDYFYEMRAWIGVKLAFVVDIPEEAAVQTSTIEGAINAWAGQFSAKEIALVGQTGLAADQAFSHSVRRVLRLRGVLDEIARTVNTGTVQGLPPPAIRFDSPHVQAYYTSKLTPPR